MSTAEIVIQSVEAVTVVTTLVFINQQIRLQRRELKAQTGQIEASKRALGFETYQRISERYMDLIWRAAEAPDLNCVWEPLPAERKRDLDEALGEPNYGVWHVMDETERRCYRYTRQMLETFEHAYQAYVKDFNDVGGDEWTKWQGWIRIWRTTRYWDYVLAESRPLLLPSFLQALDAVPANGAAAPSSEDDVDGSRAVADLA